MHRKISDSVYCVGSQDWDRRLFDELIPLPQGTSYNSYLVKGSARTALIDAVDPPKCAELLANLKALGVEKLDYVVANHCEQDHSGAIPAVLERFPGTRVATNAKCRELLKDHLHIPDDKFLVLGEGERLDLGGLGLEFIMAPWVHWPETQFTWLREEKILFTCDFLGSHLATSGLFSDRDEVLPGARRYYAEIMMPFRTSQPKYLDRIESLSPELICPSHGPVHKKPFFILDAYREWSSDKVKNIVVLPWVSMHGSTEAMAHHLIDSLMVRGVEVKPFKLTETDLGELASALVDAATVVLGTSTALVGPHPQGLYAAALVGALRPKTRFLSLIGSYGWGTKAPETVKSLLANLKAEMLEPVYIKGAPRAEDLAALDRLADAVLEKHRGIGVA
jgi:flavorubredoxin